MTDYSVKHIGLRCPDGAALIAYVGIGMVNGVHISDWVRQILRGESRTVDQSLILLRESATRDLGRYVVNKVHHTFTVGAVVNGGPWIAQIRNYALEPFRPGTVKVIVRPKAGQSGIKSQGPPLREFRTVAREAGTRGGVTVVGPPGAVSFADYRLLDRLLRAEPRTGEQVRQLLVAINRRASEHPTAGKVISRHCITTYMPVLDQGEAKTEIHDVVGAPTPIVTPFLLSGIDITEIQRAMFSMFKKGANHDLAKLGQAAVTPRNPLR